MDPAEEPSAPEMSILDLPELALECMLEKLSPAGLSSMAKVCSSLRERCRSNYYWEKRMRDKWGRVIGPAAEWEWKRHLEASRKGGAAGGIAGGHERQNKWIGVLSCVWPISWIKAKVESSTDSGNGRCKRSPPPDESIMSWYLSLESGSFWFPAQVYNRDNGHVGFMLSCYDAQVSYDRHTDTFQARYSPHGRTMVIEDGVKWNRMRAPPVDTPAHDLHISDCLNDLHPEEKLYD